MATIKEIAMKSNVSPSTVSRVLNNDRSLSVAENTRNRVLEVAKDLGYTTIRSRRKKAGKQASSYKIGIFMSYSIEEELSDPYYLSIRQGVERQCRDMGVETIEIYRIQNQLSQLNDELDGLIVIGMANTDLVNQLHNKIRHFIYVDYSPHEDRYDSVLLDFDKSTNLALDHLLELGYQRIGYIGGEKIEYASEADKTEQSRQNIDGRYKAFQEKMEKLGKEVDHMYIGEFTMAEGYRLMKESISKGNMPEAYFIASDPMAVGALRALQEADIKVPEEVALVSFDDVEMAKYASCPLTTVHVPTELMGRTGVKLLMDRLDGRNLPLKVIVPTRLVIRESCGSNGRNKI